jgi:polyisoprenoid-binding protein YceI
MRYALPILLLLAMLIAAPGCSGCGRGPASESATIGEAVEEEVKEAAEGEEAIDDSGAIVYTISDQSYIGWAGRKPLGTHFGQFPSFEGTVTVRDGDLTTARVDITFHVTELSSDDTRLTGVLLDNTWFAVDEHPDARFTSTSIEPAGDGYTVSGNLEIRGIRKSVTFPAEIDLEDDLITVFAEFNIDRTAWEIGRGHVEDLVVYKDVEIELDVIAEAS